MGDTRNLRLPNPASFNGSYPSQVAGQPTQAGAGSYNTPQPSWYTTMPVQFPTIQRANPYAGVGTTPSYSGYNPSDPTLPGNQGGGVPTVGGTRPSPGGGPTDINPGGAVGGGGGTTTTGGTGGAGSGGTAAPYGPWNPLGPYSPQGVQTLSHSNLTGDLLSIPTTPGDIGQYRSNILNYLNNALGPGGGGLNAALPGDISSMGTGTQSIDQLLGPNSPFMQNVQGQLNPLFQQQQAQALAQAKESAGNLTGSGLGNILGTTLGNVLNQQSQQLLNYGLQGAGLESQRQALGAQLAQQRNLQQYGTQADIANQNASRLAQLSGQYGNTGVGPNQVASTGGLGQLAGPLGSILGSLLGNQGVTNAIASGAGGLLGWLTRLFGGGDQQNPPDPTGPGTSGPETPGGEPPVGGGGGTGGNGPPPPGGGPTVEPGGGGGAGGPQGGGQPTIPGGGGATSGPINPTPPPVDEYPGNPQPGMGPPGGTAGSLSPTSPTGFALLQQILGGSVGTGYNPNDPTLPQNQGGIGPTVQPSGSAQSFNLPTIPGGLGIPSPGPLTSPSAFNNPQLLQYLMTMMQQPQQQSSYSPQPYYPPRLF